MFRSLILSVAVISLSHAGFAQAKTETIKVAGECGTCKKKIETAAKKAGATFASWDADSKELTVTYNSTSSNTAKIEKTIAAAGYDTQDFKASEKAYKKLDDCCQYDRTTLGTSKSCCKDDKCKEAGCMKDGKCAPDKSCCKESGCDTKECCNKS